MRIFHCSFGHVSRSSGRSAVQTAAYITGEVLHEERRGITANYSNRSNIIYSKTMAPEWAGDEFRDINCWNIFENYEDEYAKKRYKSEETQQRYMSSARTAATLIYALPNDFSPEQNIELVEEICHKFFLARGLPVTTAIHNDEGNIHVHFIFSTRAINQDGTISYTKDREVTSRRGLFYARQFMADTTNNLLEKHGKEGRVDERSFKNMGSGLIASGHEGWNARNLQEMGLESRKILENQEIKDKNLQILVDNPHELLILLTSKSATFSEQGLLKLIQKRCENDLITQYLFESCMKVAIDVGVGIDGQKRYTTQAYKEQETNLMETLDKMLDKTVAHEIPLASINARIKEFRESGKAMSDEQENAVRAFCGNQQVSLLVGRAGTGKTTGVLSHVVKIHEQNGYKVMGMALAADAAQNLEIETGCASNSIAFYSHKWAHVDFNESYEKYIPDEKTVLLVDEAGMVGTRLWHEIVDMASKTGAKVLFVGDDHQFKAVEAGDVFRKAVDMLRVRGRLCELTEIFRQRVDWMREASMNLAALAPEAALIAYEKNGHVRECASQQEMIAEIAQAYVQKRLENPDTSGHVLSNTNEMRQSINKAIREILMQKGVIGQTVGNSGYSLRDEVVFLHNDRYQLKVHSASGETAVMNGTRGVVESIKHINPLFGKETYELTVAVERQITETESVKDKVTFKLSEYTKLDHAYALTGHKAQGKTLDWTMVALSKYVDVYDLYTRLTRHRDDTTIFYNIEDHPTFRHLLTAITTSHKDLMGDYSILEENTQYWFNVTDYKEFGRDIAIRLRNNESIDDLMKERRDLARIIVDDKDSHRLFVLQAGLTFEKLEVVAGLKAKQLTSVEEKASEMVGIYCSYALEARDMWEQIRRTHPGRQSREHPLYDRYNEARENRNLVAAWIVEKEALCRPFVKDAHSNISYGMNPIKRQAEQHIRTALLTALSQKTDLSPENIRIKDVLQTFSRYLDARDDSADLYRTVKAKNQDFDGTLLKDTACQDQKKLNEINGDRDKLAYRLYEDFKHLEATAQKIGITIDKETIFKNAVNGERLLLVEQYKSNEMLCQSSILDNQRLVAPLSPRLMAAGALARLQDDNPKDGKVIWGILIANGIDPSEYKSNVNAMRQHQLQVSLTTDESKHQFATLQEYDRCSQVCYELLSLCKEEAGEKFYTSSYYPSFKEAQADRNEKAFAVQSLGKNSVEQEENVNKLASLMGVSVKGIPAQSDEHQLKQMVEGYILKDGIESYKIASQLLAMHAIDKETGSNRIFKALAQANIKFFTVRDDSLTYDRLVFKETLSSHDEKHVFDVLKTYDEKRIDANRCYRDYKEAQKNGLTDEANALKASYDVKTAERDFYASAVLQSGSTETVASLAQDMNVDLTKVPEQAHNDERRVHIETVKNGHDSAVRLAAKTLSDWTRSERELGIKTTAQAIYRSGLDFEYINQKTKEYDKDVVFNSLETKQEKDLYKTIEEYDYARRQTGVLYAQAKQQADAENIKIHQTASYQEFQYTIAERDLMAYRVEQLAPRDLQEKIATLRNAKIDKVSEHAARHKEHLLKEGNVSQIKDTVKVVQPSKETVSVDIESFGTYLADVQKEVSQESAEQSTAKISLLSQYRTASKETVEFYRFCQEDAKTNNTTINESEFYVLFKECQVQRDAHAYSLVTNGKEELCVDSNIDVAKVEKHADLHRTRQNIKAYLGVETDADFKVSKKVSANALADKVDSEKDLSSKPMTRMVLEAGLDIKNLYTTAERGGSFDKIDGKEINRMLVDRLPELAVHVLGQPQRQNTQKMEWSGSREVFTGGDKKGLYNRWNGRIHGNPITMIMDGFNMSFEGASDYAKSWLGLSKEVHTPTRPVSSVSKAQEAPKENNWKPVFPIPEDKAAFPDIANNNYLNYMLKDGNKLTGVYTYNDENGNVLGYVVRIETQDGRKLTPTLTYCENQKTGHRFWRWVGFGDNRPLYGLHELAQNPEKPVLIVEGEKTADAAKKIYENHVIITWPGGAGAVAKANFHPLVGRDVTIWPDNDKSGFDAADKVTKILTALNKEAGNEATVRTVDIPKEFPHKWDLADDIPEGFTLDDIKGMVGSPKEQEIPHRTDPIVEVALSKLDDYVDKTIHLNADHVETIRDHLYENLRMKGEYPTPDTLALLAKRITFEKNSQRRYQDVCRNVYLKMETGRTYSPDDKDLCDEMVERLSNIEGRIFTKISKQNPGKTLFSKDIMPSAYKEFEDRHASEKILADKLMKEEGLSADVAQKTAKMMKMHEEKFGQPTTPTGTVALRKLSLQLSQNELNRTKVLNRQIKLTPSQENRCIQTVKHQVRQETKLLQKELNHMPGNVLAAQRTKIQDMAFARSQAFHGTLRQQIADYRQHQQDMNHDMGHGR